MTHIRAIKVSDSLIELITVLLIVDSKKCISITKFDINFPECFSDICAMSKFNIFSMTN